MEKFVYLFLGFAVGVFIVLLIKVFWVDYLDRKLREKDEDDDRKIIDEINKRG